MFKITDDFQIQVWHWLDSIAIREIYNNKQERNRRFLEEAIELVQSTKLPKAKAHQLVDYVYSRHKGVPFREVGGVLLTLAAFCQYHGISMVNCAHLEMTRVSDPETIKKIQDKQKDKRKVRL